MWLSVTLHFLDTWCCCSTEIVCDTAVLIICDFMVRRYFMIKFKFEDDLLCDAAVTGNVNTEHPAVCKYHKIEKEFCDYLLESVWQNLLHSEDL